MEKSKREKRKGEEEIVSVLSLAVILWLMVMEMVYYLETSFTYTFIPDTEFSEKLKINVDITVAMPCRYVGADVLDMTGQQVMTFGALEMEDTWWELDPDQRIHFDGMQQVNSYFREQFHSIHQLLWRSGYINIFGDFPKRRVMPNKEKDACQVMGTLEINKVAGNFHITAGKTIPLPRGHAHLAVFMDDKDYNFTHRINKLSFGDPAPGIVHPLEGDEELTEKSKDARAVFSHICTPNPTSLIIPDLMSYQYFITVVPTYVSTYSYRGSTFQYSVSEQSREIAHDKAVTHSPLLQNSHGTPGIFFKYDVSALRVNVHERHEPLLAFLMRLCGIIGGVMTCSGLMSSIVSLAVDCFTCRFFQRHTDKTETVTTSQKTTTLLLATELVQTETQPLLTSTTITSNMVFVSDAPQSSTPES
ncbi:Endoplasmic reticulum-Golgi intermediate compartment protein 2 [Portunus trituberculatus]|uniref:Endoplasmic reticulum-Golgi intermediate compartment protein 2 n=1 Tax=Portunus trituberculatus TaxID=210409 RepID=A0A5B7DAH9_PORTR|nr:Endoplasmic reticulum-Golgi intermediate compartment protein 2 [Portunus trituberculatus]